MANLITLEEYKESEGIQSSKEDLRLNNLIPAISQLVKTYCGNSIVDYYTTQKTEYLNINWNTTTIQLTESPITEVISVEERSSYSSAYNLLTTGAYEYYVDFSTDSIFRTTGSTGYRNWSLGPGAVKVVYNAGYSTAPLDLKLAAIDLVTYYIKDEHKERQTLAGASTQNASTTSMTNSPSFPDHIKRVLDLYKNF